MPKHSSKPSSSRFAASLPNSIQFTIEPKLMVLIWGGIWMTRRIAPGITFSSPFSAAKAVSQSGSGIACGEMRGSTTRIRCAPALKRSRTASPVLFIGRRLVPIQVSGSRNGGLPMAARAANAADACDTVATSSSHTPPGEANTTIPERFERRGKRVLRGHSARIRPPVCACKRRCILSDV